RYDYGKHYRGCFCRYLFGRNSFVRKTVPETGNGPPARLLRSKGKPGYKGLTEGNMAFLLAHWHCIVPVIAIAVVVLLQNRGKKKQDGEKNRFIH
ncbi:MAG: hypothetical protein LBT33_07940, partial [Spirochaetia bacterium]|nr:hypothetical protein [Spirochaetia bacterium]